MGAEFAFTATDLQTLNRGRQTSAEIGRRQFVYNTDPIDAAARTLPAASAIPPPPSTSVQTGVRAVEASRQSGLDADARGFDRNAANPVLRLIQRSAEVYAELVESGVDPASAAAISGSPPPAAGGQPEALDTYA